MKLKDYLKKNKITGKEFARLIDVSEVTVSGYVRGKGIPSNEVFERILDITKGEVTPNDFYNIAIEEK